MIYPIDSTVSIVSHKKKPSNWNKEMMSHRGMTARVVGTGSTDDMPDSYYRYKLDISPWTWRHIDLKLVALPKPDPNLAFRSRKREHR